MAETNIELRSEKVRSIIGKIPPVLLRVGIMIITTVIIIILALMYSIPYPQTTNLDIVIAKNNQEYIARGNILIKDAKSIQLGQKADILLFSLKGNYSLKGMVNKITESNGNAYVEILITDTNNEDRLSILPLGSATILISNTSILKRIFQKKL